MRLSIIVVTDKNNEDIVFTLNSIETQSCKDFQLILITCGANDYIEKKSNTISTSSNTNLTMAFNLGIKKAEGEYLLFLKSGDKLSHDRVIEELYLNGLDKDIIFTNIILQDTNKGVEEYIFTPKIIRASNLVIDLLPFQGLIISRSLINQNRGLNDNLLLSSVRFVIIESLLNAKKSYKHVNLFTSICQEIVDDREETLNSLDEILDFFAHDFTEYASLLSNIKDEKYHILLKFKETFIFTLFLQIRNFANKLHFYELKATIKRELNYKKNKRYDRIRKKDIEQKIYNLPECILHRNNDNSDIIVSLTSYGNRVSESAPYAIYSLFTQTQLPNRIILLLDYENWNENNLPPLLKRLKLSGLEIMFCEDIRSYKKLVPLLRLFPDNAIITFDDDFYYNENLIAQSLEIYEKSDKKSVICHWARIVEKVNGDFLPYSKWKDDKYSNKFCEFAPLGGEGTLYPPSIFHSDVMNKDLFMNLCPTSDDLWFWYQYYRMGVKVILIEDSCKDIYNHVNSIEYLKPRGKKTLYSENFFEGRDDINLEKIINFYKYSNKEDSAQPKNVI